MKHSPPIPPFANRGFTLIEIMIVVAIIALLAVIAVPNLVRARKRAQGVSIRNDLRMIDNAMDQYGTEYIKVAGVTIPVLAWRAYLKPNSRLYTYNSSVMGDIYGDQVMGTLPTVPSTDWDAFVDTCDSSFWAPYVRSN